MRGIYQKNKSRPLHSVAQSAFVLPFNGGEHVAREHKRKRGREREISKTYRSTGVNPSKRIPLFSTVLAESYKAMRLFINSLSLPMMRK